MKVMVKEAKNIVGPHEDSCENPQASWQVSGLASGRQSWFDIQKPMNTVEEGGHMIIAEELSNSIHKEKLLENQRKEISCLEK